MPSSRSSFPSCFMPRPPFSTKTSPKPPMPGCGGLDIGRACQGRHYGAMKRTLGFQFPQMSQLYAANSDKGNGHGAQYRAQGSAPQRRNIIFFGLSGIQRSIADVIRTLFLGGHGLLKGMGAFADQKIAPTRAMSQCTGHRQRKIVLAQMYAICIDRQSKIYPVIDDE